MRETNSVCNRDCFNCPHPDCILETLEAADYQAQRQAEKAAFPRTQKQRKLAAKQRAYREANREELAAKKRAYYEANREELAAKHRAYYEANREVRRRAYADCRRSH